MRRWVIVVLTLLVAAGMSAAQDEPVEGVPVEITASEDGAILKGELFYPVVTDEYTPAVLLLHQNSGQRGDWLPLIPALTGAGFVALAVDLRGFGETGGGASWTKAQTDTHDWLAYLREDPTVYDGHVLIIGASIGSNLALVGCAADEMCLGAAALSPGLNYFNVKPQEAVTDGLSGRSVLLISSLRDTQSALGTRIMANEARGDLLLRMYNGSVHGTGLFASRGDGVIALIVDWLSEVVGAAGLG